MEMASPNPGFRGRHPTVALLICTIERKGGHYLRSTLNNVLQEMERGTNFNSLLVVVLLDKGKLK